MDDERQRSAIDEWRKRVGRQIVSGSLNGGSFLVICLIPNHTRIVRVTGAPVLPFVESIELVAKIASEHYMSHPWWRTRVRSCPPDSWADHYIQLSTGESRCAC